MNIIDSIFKESIRDYNKKSLIVEDLVKEGGNAVKGVVRINKKNVQPTADAAAAKVAEVLKIDKKQIALIGSGGKKDTSGDLDFGVGGVKKIEEFLQKAKHEFDKAGIDCVANFGLKEVSIKWPITNEDGKQPDSFVQVDLMPTENLEYIKWGNACVEGQKYKTAVRNILITAIAGYSYRKVLEKTTIDGKEVPVTIERYILLMNHGLYKKTRSYAGKKPGTVTKTPKNIKSEFITDDPKKIAKLIFTPSTKPEDLLTVEDVFKEFKKTKLYKDKEMRDTVLSKVISYLEENGVDYPSWLEPSKRVQVNEGGASGHMTHLFEDSNMTFGELKEIFTKLFSGEIKAEEKTDGQALAITFKDGEVKAARNTKTLRDPMSIADLEKMFEGRGAVFEAFSTSMRDISKAISTLSKSEIKKIFNDGQNFMAFEIIYPPTKNVVDYGGRCLIQLHGVNIYDENFKKISEDKAAADRLYELLKKHKALNQETFEITNHTKLKLKDTKTAAESLKDILGKLKKIQGKLPDETTIAQYADTKYKMKIVAAMKEAGIDPKSHKEFLSALAKRLSHVSDNKLSKNDLKAVAQKEGMDTKGSEFKDFVAKMESTEEEDNQEVIMQVETLVVDAGMQLMKNFTGFVSADKSKSAQILTKELEETMKQLEANEDKLSESGLKAFKKNLVKLQKFGKESSGVEGIVFLYKGKVYKMTGNFGAINQLLGIMKYGR